MHQSGFCPGILHSTASSPQQAKAIDSQALDTVITFPRYYVLEHLRPYLEVKVALVCLRSCLRVQQNDGNYVKSTSSLNNAQSKHTDGSHGFELSGCKRGR